MPDPHHVNHGVRNLDDEGIVDHSLCTFSFLGQVYDLRFHPRPDRRSPLAIATLTGDIESRRRYYLRVDTRRKLLHAVHGENIEQNTPFDDIAFRLVYVGEAIPRADITVGDTRWCSCPRVRGMHPKLFCNRIVIPNWEAYWCWRREQAEPKLRVDLAEQTTPELVRDPAEAVASAVVAYADLPSHMRDWQRDDGTRV